MRVIKPQPSSAPLTPAAKVPPAASATPGSHVSYQASLANCYALGGVRIFPCRHDKKPFIENWNERATADLEQVQSWWAKFPEALIGLPCGRNDVFVVDVDCHKGAANGLLSLWRVKPRNALFPSGLLTVRTPNNGLHLWFRMPTTPVRNTASRLGVGVDTRGVGGYVIAPGSTLPNGASWKITSEITVAEEQLTAAAAAAGLEEQEIERTIASGLGAGINAPRTVTLGGNTNGPAWADVSNGGSPRPTYRNAQLAIQSLGVTLQHDTFHRRKTIGGHLVGRFAGEITDDAIAALRDLVVTEYGFDPRKEHVVDAANALCISNPCNPVQDLLARLKWDGQGRLDTWLIDYAGAKDTPLNRAMGVLLIVAMVRRAVQPGCKFDIMTILEGPQGCGKSSLAVALAGGPENFTDVPLLGRDTKVVAEALVGRWVAEVSELVGLKRSEVEDVKALISRTDDRARPAYGRFVESCPRTCVLIGTTNSAEYLADDTGNRRFVPVRVGEVDLKAFIRDRDQLFAEAVLREKNYGPLTLPPSVWHDAASQAEKRRVVDPWVERLREALKQAPVETLSNGFKRIANNAVEAALRLEPHNCNTGTSRRITACMKDLGWEPARWRVPGDKVRGFVKQ